MNVWDPLTKFLDLDRRVGNNACPTLRAWKSIRLMDVSDWLPLKELNQAGVSIWPRLIERPIRVQ